MERTTNGIVNGLSAYHKHKTENFDKNFDKIDWGTKEKTICQQEDQQ